MEYTTHEREAHGFIFTLIVCKSEIKKIKLTTYTILIDGEQEAETSYKLSKGYRKFFGI